MEVKNVICEYIKKSKAVVFFVFFKIKLKIYLTIKKREKHLVFKIISRGKEKFA